MADLSPWPTKAQLAKWFRWSLIAASALMINLACNLMSSDIYPWLYPTAQGANELHLDGLLVFFVLLLVGVYLGKLGVTKLLKVETRPLARREARQRRALLWFLSELRDPNSALTLNGITTRNGDLEHDLQELAAAKRQAPYWPWEQPLRGIWHNARTVDGKEGPLEYFILIGSRESVKQAKLFGQMFEQFTALKRVQILVWLNRNDGLLVNTRDLHGDTASHAGWDFEHFDQIYEGLLRLIKTLGDEKYGIPPRAIAIDLTGGTKPTTVAAAAATINNAVVNQYVCTNPRDRMATTWEFDVLEYDLLVQSGLQNGST